MKRPPHIVQLVIVSVLVALTMIVVGCGKRQVRLKADAVEDRARVPVLDVRHVTTLISDSGITRYRITAERWQVYDKAEPAFWNFPQGVRLEQFDEQLKVVAWLEARMAYYDQEAKLWRLRGHVRALNTDSTRFMTEELYWDQTRECIYSDSAVAIQQKQGLTIRGIGFDATQDMTRYTVRKTNGLFPAEE